MPDDAPAAPSFAIVAGVTPFRTVPASAGQVMPACGRGSPARAGGARVATGPAVRRA